VEAEAFAEEASEEAEDSAAVSVVDSEAFEAGSEVSEEALALAGSVVPSPGAASEVGLDSASGSALATRGSTTLIRPIPTTHTPGAILTIPIARIGVTQQRLVHKLSRRSAKFAGTIIQLMPDRSRTWPKREAKNVSSIGIRALPPSERAPKIRSASLSLSTRNGGIRSALARRWGCPPPTTQRRQWKFAHGGPRLSKG
jgi:hypothetical protein